MNETIQAPDRFAVQRVRHDLKARLLQVRRIVPVSPAMLRVTLAGDSLEGFHSASFDDHVKLLLPARAGEKPAMPEPGPNGLVFPTDVPRPAMRDFTPRRYDAAAGELDIEFVMHDHGPSIEWAKHAAPGDFLGIAGPRGSFVMPTTFDWHVLLGDETALPAIARRLEELPAHARALVRIETRTPQARIALETRCDADIGWVTAEATAGAATALEAAARALQLPAGEGFVWAAGEYDAIRRIRQHFVSEAGIDKRRIRAASYWRRGAQASHEVFGD